jgi:hypothetical protein
MLQHLPLRKVATALLWLAKQGTMQHQLLLLLELQLQQQHLQLACCYVAVAAIAL